MKKVIGVLLILVGLGLMGVGIIAITDVASKSETLEGRLGNELSHEYRTRSQQQAVGGLAFGGVGLVVLIVGVVLVASKSSSQRKKEAELAVLKRMHSSGNMNFPNVQSPQAQITPQIPAQPTVSSPLSPVDKIDQIERLAGLRDQGVLSEEEFQAQKARILQS